MSSDESATVRSIVEEWLAAHGFDGISCGECACFAGDLMPCQDGPTPGASPCVGVRCGGSPECGGCEDYSCEWAEYGGAGASADYCPVASRRRADLLADLRVEAVRDPDMDERVPADARWWRCQACGASYVMERGVRPLFCPMCGRRYGWPELEVQAGGDVDAG